MNHAASEHENLGIVLDREARIPLYRQIEATIRARIASGELAIGERLPPERKLAGLLGVDRTTVIAAYRELAADGILMAHVGRGTVVAARHSGFDPDGTHGTPAGGVAWDSLLAMRDEDDPILAEVSALAGRPDVISFAGGVPAPESYPVEAFRNLLVEAFEAGGASLLQYSPPEGLSSLRRVLAERMESRGMPVRPAGIIACAGSQQGLYLLARALIGPDDAVVVETPTYLGALQVFRAVGARIIAIPADRAGMDVERLGDLLRRRTVKLIYVLPTFQNPTGSTMPLARRERLVALARRHGVAVIEDDPYGEIRYGGQHVPSLLELDHAPGSPVIYLSTFSKVLFPGFRLGWVAAPVPVVERLAWVKAVVDLDTNPLVQWAVGEYVRRGRLDEHIGALRRLYLQRRDRMVESLERHLGTSVSFRPPDGGFYVWARLTNGLRAREMLADAASCRVAFVPGDVFHVDGGGRETMRLAFSAVDLDEIDEGVSRLASAAGAAGQRRAEQRRGRSTRIV